MPRTTLTSGDLTHEIAWSSEGSGAPVLLVNGLSSPSAVWFRLVPLLATDHRVLTFDNLGTGETGIPAQPWTMADMAEAAAAVIRASGEQRVAVLGISMGGLIAQELALVHPELVASLVLVATHAGAAHATGDPEAVQAIMSSASLPSDERLKAILPFTYASGTPLERAQEDEAVRAAYPTSEAGYGGQLAAVVSYSSLDRLGEIGCPTLVLHGEEDRLVYAGSSELLSEAIPGARRHVLVGAGHQLFTDQPEAGAEVVRSFLKDAS